MRWNKKWRKIVQTAFLLVLVTALACPLPAIAQTEGTVKEENEVVEEKDDTSTDDQPSDAEQTENSEEEKSADKSEEKEKDTNTKLQLPAPAQAVNASLSAPAAAKAKNSEPSPRVKALIEALGGSEYATITGPYNDDVLLIKSATVSSGTLTVPEGTTLSINTGLETESPVTLTLEASVNFTIEDGGYVELTNGGFLKVDCAVSGVEESIQLGSGSSVSSATQLPDGLIAPYYGDEKVVSCTDWRKKRTAYAATESSDPEGFIIKEDGRGAAYERLGWDTGSAFDKSEAGDTIYLLKDFETTKQTDGASAGISRPLKRGVTLVIKEGQTFSIGFWSLAIMANPGLFEEFPNGEGTIIALAGSQCIMPWNLEDSRTPFVGTDEKDTLLKLDKGVLRLELPQAMVSPTRLFAAPQAAAKATGGRPAHVVLTENSQGTFCNPLYLRVINDGMDCTVGENSTLTVTSLLVLDGNQKPAKNNPSNLTLNKNAKIRTQGNEGIIYLDQLTETYIQEGASFSADSIDGNITLKEERTGFQSFFKGLLSVGPNAGLELQKEKLFGGPDAYMSVKSGTAEVTLGKAAGETEPAGKAPNLLKLTDGSEAVLNKDWTYDLISNKAPFNNYLKDLTTGTDSTLTLNATLTMPAGSTLNNNGTIVVGPEGKLILDENATLNNNGQIIVQPGGEVRGADSFKLLPFQNMVFRSELEGYTNPETLDVTVKSNGTKETGDLTAAISGNNAEAFSLTPSGNLDSLSPDADPKSFTVSPKTGLKAGTYTAEVTVSSERISATFPVSFTVTKPSSGGSGDTPGTSDPNFKGNTPMTGDDSPSMGRAVLLMVLSIIAGSTAVLRYRRKRREIR